jgi:DNA-binding GntR family transcriptional regulator
VVTGILKAISLRKLRPGMKLGEEELATAFGTNRAHIRQVLSHLGSLDLVRLVPNRGAFVAQPTVAEAHAVFEARAVLERAAVEAAVARRTADTAKVLQASIAAERAKREADRWDGLDQSAGFHVELARLSGNPVLAKFMEELALRTSLIIAEFEPPGAEDHCPEAHPDIAAKIAAGDREGALRAMEQHLAAMKARLDLATTEEPPVDLVAIFRDLGLGVAGKA